MKYFNGFSLQNEAELFSSLLKEDDFCVAGFSYGAQKAFEFAYHSTTRIDRLILISPAFFQTQKPSFIRAQLRYFEAEKSSYVKQFLENVTYPSTFSLQPYLHTGTKDELEALLSYVWDRDKIKVLQQRGTSIEVFLGEYDKIIDIKAAQKFFADLSTLYIFKKSGHLLEC